MRVDAALCGWMRGYGGSAGIPELTEATFPLDRADGHRLALLASGLTGRPYYRGRTTGARSSSTSKTCRSIRSRRSGRSR